MNTATLFRAWVMPAIAYLVQNESAERGYLSLNLLSLNHLHRTVMETYLLVKLHPQVITPEAFLPFGQVIFACPDDQPYSDRDAQLQLQNGIPRLYIMRQHNRGLKFNHITRHQRCTQCLGALEGKEWLMAVAASTEAAIPEWESITAFRIPGNCFIKLHGGTWHAGPYFEQATIDFYSLELSDTNEVDHHTCNLLETYGVDFEIVPDSSRGSVC